MLPMSLVLVWFWYLNHTLLVRCLPERQQLTKTIFLLSIVGSVFLILYVIFLGTEGRVYEFLRRLGIYVFFGGTGIAQLLTSFGLRSKVRALVLCSGRAKYSLWAWRVQLTIVVLMLALGPLNIVLKQIMIDSRQVENIIEWNFGLIMFLWYGCQAIVWQGFSKATISGSS